MKVFIPAEEGSHLDATVFFPTGSRGNVVIINCAMGIDQLFYEELALSLSDSGFIAITYNYANGKDFLRRKFEHLDGEVYAWGAYDFTSVVKWCIEKFPESKIHVVGHGVGGIIPAFSRQIKMITGLVTVNTQLLNWKQFFYPGILRWLRESNINDAHYKLWGVPRQVDLNILRDTNSYFHHRKKIRDIAVDSSTTSLKNPTYFHEFEGRLLTLLIADDGVINRDAVLEIHKRFVKAQKIFREIMPTDVHRPYLGFFGLFLPHESNALWNMIRTWFDDDSCDLPEYFAHFYHDKFPLIFIDISSRNPTDSAIEKYIATMKSFLERGPIYVLIDLSKVHWADHKFISSCLVWIRANADLIRTMQKLVVYVAPNPIIRAALAIFHNFELTDIMKLYYVFKEKSSAIAWLKHKMEKDGIRLDLLQINKQCADPDLHSVSIPQ